MTILAAIVMSSCLSSSSSHPHLDCLQRVAGDFASRLGLARSFSVRIIATTPAKNARTTEWAWSRRNTRGGCDIDFLPAAARHAETIAHEVCHCHLHYDMMTVSGEVRVSGEELRRAEAEADSCAARLTR